MRRWLVPGHLCGRGATKSSAPRLGHSLLSSPCFGPSLLGPHSCLAVPLSSNLSDWGVGTLGVLEEIASMAPTNSPQTSALSHTEEFSLHHSVTQVRYGEGVYSTQALEDPGSLHLATLPPSRAQSGVKQDLQPPMSVLFHSPSPKLI